MQDRNVDGMNSLYLVQIFSLCCPSYSHPHTDGEASSKRLMNLGAFQVDQFVRYLHIRSQFIKLSHCACQIDPPYGSLIENAWRDTTAPRCFCCVWAAQLFCWVSAFFAMGTTVALRVAYGMLGSWGRFWCLLVSGERFRRDFMVTTTLELTLYSHPVGSRACLNQFN